MKSLPLHALNDARHDFEIGRYHANPAEGYDEINFSEYMLLLNFVQREFTLAAVDIAQEGE